MEDLTASQELIVTELAELRQKVAELEAALVERERENAALRESEARYRELFNNMSSGVAVYEVRGEGHDFIFKDFNKAGERIDGQSKDELIGNSVFDMRPEIERFGLIDVFREVWTSGKPIRHPVKMYKDAHVSGWYENFVYKLPSGEIVAIFDDISAQKQAEQALRESEERWQFALEGAGDGIWDWDAQTNTIFFSHQWKAMLGFEDHEIGNTLEEWDKRLHPEDREAVYAEIKKHFSGQTPLYTGEYRLQCKDGTYRWILGRGKVIQWSGENRPLRMIGTHTDITERKQMEDALRRSEKELKTLFSAMTEMVVLHEMIYNEQGDAVDYRITDCNPTFSAITGIAQENAVGQLATQVYQTERAPYLEEYSRVAQTGEPYGFTVYYPPLDKYFMISAVSPQNGRFATITTDITAMKHIQNIISAKNKELENYLYVTSHDLRAPLVNIQGFSQRLQKQTTAIKTLLAEHLLEEQETEQQLEQLIDEGIPRSLDFIFTNVSKMETLINGLLKISRTGRVKMSIRKIDMNALIEKIVRAFSFQVENAGAKIEFAPLPECYGDADLLDQLFSNIIGNALKYRSPERQLRIALHAQREYKKVLYTIRDTGIGIAQRHLEKIWDVFYQVDSQSPGAGEGIGLSIVKRIVDKHKGKIWVKSDEGEGSAFYVELPGDEFSE